MSRTDDDDEELLRYVVAALDRDDWSRDLLMHIAKKWRRTPKDIREIKNRAELGRLTRSNQEYSFQRPQGPKHVVTTRVSAPVKARLQQLASAHRKTVSAVAAELLAHATRSGRQPGAAELNGIKECAVEARRALDALVQKIDAARKT